MVLQSTNPLIMGENYQGNGVYSIAKAGINSLTQVLGLDYAEHGVTVTIAGGKTLI